MSQPSNAPFQDDRLDNYIHLETFFGGHKSEQAAQAVMAAIRQVVESLISYCALFS